MASTPKYITDKKSFDDERKRLVELRRETRLSAQKMQTAVSEFDKVSGLPAKIQNAHDTAIAAKNEISTIKGEVTKTSEDAQVILKNLGVAEDEIDKLLQKKELDSQAITDQIKHAEEANKNAASASESINKLREEITNQLGRAVSGSLSSAFENRAKKISSSKWVWFSTLVVLAIASPFVAVYVFTHIDASKVVGDNLIAMNIFRLGALSPLIYFIGYASVQYSRERSIQEKYEFKTSTARSLPAYMAIVKEEFYGDNTVIAGHEDDLIKFAFESIRSVYTHPFDDEKSDSVITTATTGISNAAAKVPKPKLSKKKIPSSDAKATTSAESAA